MISLLVADDEDIVRSAVKSILSRSNIPIEQVSEAGSGEEAINMARLTHPDIILMDVKMPGLSGLEAARTIRSENPDTAVIMLTAYDEFSFSQEALRLGAVDYLLKPIRPKSLLDTLERVCVQIEVGRQQVLQSEQVTNRLRDSLPMVESRLVYDLVNGLVSSKKADEMIVQHLGKILTRPLVLLVDIDRFKQTVKSMEAEKLDQLNNLLVGIVQRAIPEPQRCLVGQLRPGVIAVILSGDQKFSRREEVRSLANAIRHAIEAGAPVTATIGIGHTYSDLSMVSASYSEATNALLYKIRFGRNFVIDIEDVQSNNRPAAPYPVNLESELVAAIRLGQRNQSESVLNQIVDWTLKNLGDPPQSTLTRLMEINTLISRAVIDAGASQTETLAIAHQQITNLAVLKTAPEMRIWALESLDLMMTNIPSGDRGDRLVERATAFMVEKMSQPGLGLKEVAAEVHVSPSHLAHVLKEKTGHSYTQIITDLRMAQAKRLLATTNMTIASIALTVGYEDPAYFHRIFRRENNTTPADFRTSVQQVPGTGRR